MPHDTTMTEPEKKKKTLMQLTAPISSRVHMDGIRLVGSQIESHIKDLEPMPVHFSIRSKTRHDPDGKKIIVLANFDVCSEHKVGEEKLLHITATYCAEYNVDFAEEPEKENLDAFGRMNGVYNLWPYWREYVQSTTTRLGLPPLTLPALTGDALQKLYEGKEEESEKKEVEEEATDNQQLEADSRSKTE
jgi:preprotein translocase subunit SecB